MPVTGLASAEPRYSAFISYRHGTNDRLATLLQAGIQRIAVPWHRRTPSKVFLDRGDLSVQPAVWTTLKATIGQCEYFILLASMDALASPSVSKEVEEWRRVGQPERTILVLVDGELHWDSDRSDFDSASTVFPRGLAGFFREEPLWIDLRWATPDIRATDPRLQDSCASIAATIRATPKRELIGEELRIRRRGNRIAAGVVTGLACLTIAVGVIALLFFQQKREAQRQKDEAVKQRDIADIQRREALAAALAATASADQSQPDADLLPRSLILAIESYRLKPSFAAEVALRRGLRLVPTIVRRTELKGVRARQFSGDGRLMRGEEVATQRQGIWSTETGALVFMLPVAAERHSQLSYDGSLVGYIPSPADYRIRPDLVIAWGSTYAHTQTLKMSDDIRSLEFSRDGRRLVVVTEEHDGPHGGFELYTVDGSGEFRSSYDENYESSPFEVAFHPDNEHLAVSVVGKDEHTSIFGPDGKELSRIPESGGLEFIGDGRELAINGKVYDWAARKMLRRRSPARGSVLGQQRVLRTTPGMLVVQDANDGHELKRIISDRVLSVNSESPGPFVILPGQRIMTMTNGYILVWDLNADDLRTRPTGGMVKVARLPKDFLESLALSPDATSLDGKTFAAQDKDLETIVIASQDGTFKRTARRKLGRAEVLEFSPAGDLLLIAYGMTPGAETMRLPEIEVWNASLTKRVANVRIGEPEKGDCRFSAGTVDSGRFAAAQSCNENGRWWSHSFVWDYDGRAITVIDNQGTGDVDALAISPNGEYLGATMGDRVRVWRISERGLVIDERQPKEGIIVAFSMDSRHAVVAGEGNTVRVWNLANRTEVSRIDCCRPRSYITFDRSGTDLALGRPPAELLPWDTRRLIERACAHIPANLGTRDFAALLPGETYHLTCPNVPVAQ